MAEPTESPRLRSLDGVRGLASFVVLFWHAFLVAQPHLQSVLRSSDTTPGSLYWWLFSSPLSILTSGQQAVLVFFLLSGIVLTLPVVRSPRFDWVAYYPRRLVRIYVPVFASVVLGVLFLIAVPRTPVGVPAWQWDDNAHSFDLFGAATAAALVNPRPGVNGPLWSLTWEMGFSVLLPLFVFVAVRSGRWWIASIVVAVLLVDIGVVADINPMKFLPVFLIGALTAVNIDRVLASAGRVNRSRRHAWLWAAILGCSVLFTTASRSFSDFISPQYAWVNTVLLSLVIIGCMGLVFVAIGSAAARRLLESAVVQWTGRLSFSLYLVHVPLMVTAVYAFGWEFWWLSLIVAVPLSIGLAIAFMRFVEQPAHVLSKRVGKLADRRARSRTRSSAGEARAAAPGTLGEVPGAAAAAVQAEASTH